MLDLESPVSTVELDALFGDKAERLAHFWKLWSDHYLKDLPPLVSRFKTQGAPQVGSVVIVRDDATPRYKWPLGIVEETYRGRDGLIRTLKVRTQKGSIVRAIQNLHDLEISRSNEVIVQEH